LLLSQAADKPHPNMKIAVAVDPDEEDQQAINLTINTLQKAERLAEIFTPPIHIIGCWHLPYGMENLLKQHNISLDEHSQTTSSPQKSQSKKALLRIIERAKLSHRITLHHRTGTPTLIVPQFVTDFGIDILILSSPNRHEGDDSLGSTAEDILRLTTCSVLVVKPRVLLSRQFEFG
jgi:nucleotide-binding universal stress UspA family protein